MTIFQEIVSEEYLTVSEVKEYLQKIEKERSLDEDRELPYELARTIEHVNRFSVLSAKEARELVNKLIELDKVNALTACKIADLLPQSRDELRSVYTQNRHNLDGEELDKILVIVAEYV
jgi:DNA-directed RNA polymerase subunit F